MMATREAYGNAVTELGKINKDIVFVTHVGCSVKQQEFIKKEISKYVKFDRIIVQKASFTSACNVGMESIGISYYTI